MHNTEQGMNQLFNHLFRHESGKLVAVLSRLLGLERIDVAQDLVQDTLVAAMQTWPLKGVPDNPSGWLMRVAKNRAVDYLRQQQRRAQALPGYEAAQQSGIALAGMLHQLFLPHEIEDSQLRMMFACCHPAIAPESQVAMILKILCGLSVSEIAHAFLTNDDTIAKRIYRAKEKIKLEQIDLETPAPSHLAVRLDAVLKSLYLLFNEGYNASHPSRLIRDELCEEAMRLCYLLVTHPLTALPQVKALLALMCFQASRLQARISDKGHIILLKHQQRGHWHRGLIQKGFEMLNSASQQLQQDTTGQTLSSYHIEAAIASEHAAAGSFEATNWPVIYRLYGTLQQLQPGPVVALNKAIAAAYAVNPRQAITELKTIQGLEKYYLYHAALGDIYLQNGEPGPAKKHYETALVLTGSMAEKELLRAKIQECEKI